MQEIGLDEMIAAPALSERLYTEISAVQNFLLQRVDGFEPDHRLKILFAQKVQDIVDGISSGVEVGYFRSMAVLVKLNEDSLTAHTEGSRTWLLNVCALLMPTPDYSMMQSQLSNAQQPVETSIRDM